MRKRIEIHTSKLFNTMLSVPRPQVAGSDWVTKFAAKLDSNHELDHLRLIFKIKYSLYTKNPYLKYVSIVPSTG